MSGRFDARDRARLRRRLDREAPAEVDPYDAIEGWLKDSEYGDIESGDMASLDLDEYLRRTGHIELAAQERLRHLAIFVENYFSALAPDALDRIYEAAVRLEPNDHVLWHSRGISAKLVAQGSADEALLARFRKLSHRCFHRAVELDATDPGVTYSLGMWHYFFGDGSDAAEWFERTLKLDPEHGWALLYRAHCLHDRERWSEAVAAYAAVPLETFKGPVAWRTDIVREAHAYCLLRSGDRAGAIEAFGRFLERLTAEPDQAKLLHLQYLTEACRGPLRESLWPAYRRLSQLIGLPS